MAALQAFADKALDPKYPHVKVTDQASTPQPLSMPPAGRLTARPLPPQQIDELVPGALIDCWISTLPLLPSQTFAAKSTDPIPST